MKGVPFLSKIRYIKGQEFGRCGGASPFITLLHEFPPGHRSRKRVRFVIAR